MISMILRGFDFFQFTESRNWVLKAKHGRQTGGGAKSKRPRHRLHPARQGSWRATVHAKMNKKKRPVQPRQLQPTCSGVTPRLSWVLAVPGVSEMENHRLVL